MQGRGRTGCSVDDLLQSNLVDVCKVGFYVGLENIEVVIFQSKKEVVIAYNLPLPLKET